MSKETQNEAYTNSKPLNLRTRIALKILLLMYRTLSPYEYEHQFSKEITDIARAIDNYDESKEPKS